MKTLAERYCEIHRCDEMRCRARLFRAALPWHARLSSWLLGGFRGGYFAPDRQLIEGVSAATRMGQVYEEIRDYFMEPANRGWLRGRWRIRVSTTRLKQIVRSYLAPAEDCTAIESEA